MGSQLQSLIDYQLSGYINNEKVSPFHQLKMQVITPISMRLVPPVTYSFSVIYGGYRLTILITGRGPSCGLVIVLPQHFLSYGVNQLALIPILHETPWQLQIAAPKKNSTEGHQCAVFKAKFHAVFKANLILSNVIFVQCLVSFPVEAL